MADDPLAEGPPLTTSSGLAEVAEALATRRGAAGHEGDTDGTDQHLERIQAGPSAAEAKPGVLVIL